MSCRRRRLVASVFLLLTTSLAACTSIRPVVKIGLIAPFEGLHRRSGYSALAAMRAALADHPAQSANVLPLALDDSGDPAQARRAAQKLLVDGGVGAIVGPLSPAQAAASASAVEAAGIPWFLPFAPALPGARTNEPLWATALITEAARLAAQQGATALVLAGQTAGWPALPAEEWGRLTGLPVRFADDPTSIAATEAVFWMGSAEDGAAFVNALRLKQPAVPFWTGPQGEDPVFAERAKAGADLRWVIWSDEGYNSWSEAHSPSTPFAYLVYRATVDALLAVSGQQASAVAPAWFVQAYVLAEDGTSVQYPPDE